MKEDVYINTAQKELLRLEAIKKEVLRGLSIFLLVSEVFLILRIIFRLLGADPGTAFAGFIYVISGFFLIPFFGIFPQFHDEIVAGAMSADAVALIAIFSYLVLIPLAMSVTVLVIRMIKTVRQANKTIEKSHPVDTQMVDKSIE